MGPPTFHELYTPTISVSVDQLVKLATAPQTAPAFVAWLEEQIRNHSERLAKERNNFTVELYLQQISYYDDRVKLSLQTTLLKLIDLLKGPHTSSGSVIPSGGVIQLFQDSGSEYDYVPELHDFLSVLTMMNARNSDILPRQHSYLLQMMSKLKEKLTALLQKAGNKTAPTTAAAPGAAAASVSAPDAASTSTSASTSYTKRGRDVKVCLEELDTCINELGEKVATMSVFTDAASFGEAFSKVFADTVTKLKYAEDLQQNVQDAIDALQSDPEPELRKLTGAASVYLFQFLKAKELRKDKDAEFREYLKRRLKNYSDIYKELELLNKSRSEEKKAVIQQDPVQATIDDIRQKENTLKYFWNASVAIKDMYLKSKPSRSTPITATPTNPQQSTAGEELFGVDTATQDAYNNYESKRKLNRQKRDELRDGRILKHMLTLVADVMSKFLTKSWGYTINTSALYLIDYQLSEYGLEWNTVPDSSSSSDKSTENSDSPDKPTDKPIDKPTGYAEALQAKYNVFRSRKNLAKSALGLFQALFEDVFRPLVEYDGSPIYKYVFRNKDDYKEAKAIHDKPPNIFFQNVSDNPKFQRIHVLGEKMTRLSGVVGASNLNKDIIYTVVSNVFKYLRDLKITDLNAKLKEIETLLKTYGLIVDMKQELNKMLIFETLTFVKLFGKSNFQYGEDADEVMKQQKSRTLQKVTNFVREKL